MDTTTASSDNNVLVGPDLNDSRPPLDKRLYRQILLPNGLRAVLISDTLVVAMMHHDYYEHENDDEESSSDESDNDDIEQDSHHDDEDDDSEFEEQEGLREAAAAMVVGVGSMYDPPEAQGMAHFLEHMLFMGTKKYPTENGYDAFLSKQGGSDNACTELEYTVYHFEIPQEGLFQALDMFAQFFIHPLLLEDAVERELNSIESEFQLSKNSDHCRVQQLMCETCGHDAEQHPFAKFSWGNLASLKETPEKNGVCIMDLLRSFYNQYYYASNMRLVVIGAYSLDVLQKHVVDKFSNVPALPREPSPLQPTLIDKDTWDAVYESKMKKCGLPFERATLGKIFRIVPVKDIHSLLLTWQLPSQFSNWRTKPCDYIAHLLGHEAQGSLFSALKAKSWVTGLYAGVGSSGLETASSHALFNVTLSLSKEGVAKWRCIVTEMYRYIGMMRYYAASTEGLPEWIHEELKSIHELAYRYGDEVSSEDFVQELAEELAPHMCLPPERLLDGSELLFGYDPEEVKNLLDDYFRPHNMRVDLMSSTLGRAADYEMAEANEQVPNCTPDSCSEDDETFDPLQSGIPNLEPMFGARYWCRSIPEDLMNEWTDSSKPELPPPDSHLSLPPKNPFVPENLALKPLPSDDSHHPLLHCSLKICIAIGKKKLWVPCTVNKYNATKNQVLIIYEDENEKWHAVDQQLSQLTESSISRGFEGTLDNKNIKYRIVALAQDGEGPVLKFGDDSDHHVELGTHFPPIPPPSPQSRLPQLVSNTQVLKFWHLQDRKFKRPIAEMRMRLICAAANKTSFHRACADLFVNLILDSITETSYLADVCELGCSVGSSDVGFSIRVHGFDDKLMVLFELIMRAIFEFRGRADESKLPESIKEGRFEACLEVLRRRYGNSGLKASSLSSDIRLMCLQPFSRSSHSKLRTLDNVNKASFSAVVSETLETFGIEALYHGNVDLEDATKAKELILKLVNESGGAGLPRKKYPKEPVTKIPSTVAKSAANLTIPSLDQTEANTAVEIYFQVGKDNIEERVLIDLLTHMMYEPLYDQLRTKDQFGYSVSCDSRWTNGVMGMHFRVVTSTKTAAETVERIEKFLLEYRKELIEMKEDAFMEQVIGLAKNKLDIFNSLSEETDSIWGEIRDGRFDFQIHRNEALWLRSVTKSRVVAAYDEWLSPLSVDGKSDNKRRMLIVKVVGSGDADGRPVVDDSRVCDFIDESVLGFQKSIGNQTWGKITFS